MNKEPNSDGDALVSSQRGRGRPRVDEPLTSVSIRLPVAAHERLCRLATKHGLNVSDAARRILLPRLK